MKDSDPPDSDDDGWGEAADAAAAPAAEAAVDNEWNDPADLERRVAALRGQRDSAAIPVSPPPEIEPSTPPEVEPSSPPEVEPSPPTEVEPSAPPEVEPGAPPEVEPGAPPQVQPGAPPEVQPDAPPEFEPGAPPEVQPGVPPQIEPSPPPEIAPGPPPEIEPPSASRDKEPLPTPSRDLRAAAGLTSPPEKGVKGKGKGKGKDKGKKTDKAAKAPKDRQAYDSSPSLTARQKKFIVGGSVALVLAAVCAVLGWFNSKNYYLSCGTKTITANQGRFWPWGSSPLGGPAFKAIHVPSDVLCTNQHFESRTLLEDAFLDALLKQSTGLLTSGDAEQVSTAEEQLEQALLLTRAPERSAQRTLAQRLQGDVSYWRGAAQVQAAAELLQKSAAHFAEAASKRPRHTSDANAWAEHTRFVESEIDKGPKALRKDETPKEQPTFGGLSPEIAPPAVEPTPAAQVLEVQAIDAGMPEEPADAALPPADAALPKGGVLL